MMANQQNSNIKRRLWYLGAIIVLITLGLLSRRIRFIPDAFRHEQYAVLREGTKSVLVSGCAHKGIVNILARYRELFGSNPDVVVSGFHMMNADGYDEAAEERIREVARELAGTDILFYTGHCTGIPAYELMKPILKEKLIYLHAGDVVEIR